MKVHVARALSTNYVWLPTAPDGRCAIVDPGEAAPVEGVIADRGLIPAAILITHHHPDHVGGAVRLQARFDIPVYGPDDMRIPGDNRPLRDGESLRLDALGLDLTALHIPGHTRSHIALVGDGILLSGDTLFSAGCGRLFEGTPEEMLDSLDRLAALPGDTRVYCGHEYTEKNGAFAGDVEPGNAALARHLENARARLRVGQPSLPSTIATERAVNPFLRTDEPAVRAAAEAAAGHPLSSRVAVFAALRAWKDAF